jgi:hypothetical protein
MDVANTISPLLINLLIALVLFLIALLVAKGLQLITVTILKATSLDKGLAAIGFTPFLTKGEIKKSPTELLG